MKDLYETVGKTGTVVLNGLTVEVTIKEVKTSYGRDRYLVSPVSGGGEAWMENVKVQ